MLSDQLRFLEVDWVTNRVNIFLLKFTYRILPLYPLFCFLKSYVFEND